ncbi:VRR-NUC domain-containing protein [Saccharopolyspora shandongensis]|uniref:VRR-NUC domain-containing protein n=1 Tax=Saccharopolyspora shandongensis TaxID=418495 RepID=UPI0033FB364F
MSLYAPERENPVERYLLMQCRRSGLLCMKFTSPARGGVPDRIVVSHAGTVFVEVKRPGGGLEPRQRAVHAKLRRFGAEIHVIDSETSVDTLINLLLGRDQDQSRQKATS